MLFQGDRTPRVRYGPLMLIADVAVGMGQAQRHTDRAIIIIIIPITTLAPALRLGE